MRRTAVACLLLFSVILSPGRAHGFEETFVRYPSAHDFLRILMTYFPTAYKDGLLEATCKRFSTAISYLVVGGVAADSGQLAFRNPRGSFVRWWGECVEGYAKYELDSAFGNRKVRNRFLPKAILEELPPGKDPAGLAWAEVPLQTQQEIVSHLADFTSTLHGDGTDEGFLKSALERASPNSRTTLKEALNNVLFFIFLNDRFLRF
jgi:hypothetical protein